MQNPDPRELGLDPSRVERFFEVVERKIEEKWLFGGSFLIARRGKIAAARALGSSEPAKKRRAKLDDVYCIFSTTKPLTATVLLARIERGEARLVDRVAEYVPEFATGGKDKVTIADLLTHRGGFPNLAPDWPIENWDRWDETVARICLQPMEYEPGTAVHYHALTAQWIQGEIVRRLDGGKRTFAEICQAELYQPLGMKDSHMGVREDMEARRVPLQALDEESFPFPLALLEGFNLPSVQRAAIPGGGSYSTVTDLARFYQLWLNGGELDGLRLLSPAMVSLATTIHTGDAEDRLFRQIGAIAGWPHVPANRGLGFFVKGDGIFPSYFGSLASPRAFGHAGASSVMAWADPARELVFVGLSAGLIDEARSLLRWHLFSDLAQACVVE